MKLRRLRRPALLLLMILLLAGMLSLSHRRKAANQAADNPDPQAAALSLPGTAVTALRYTNPDATLSFTLGEDGAWQWADLPEFPLDGSYVEHIVQLISALHPQQTLTEPESDETYGLDDPSYTLTATLADGEEHLLTLGNQVTGDSGSYYLRQGSQSTVYIVSGDLAEALRRPIYDMAVLPELPAIADSEYRTIVLTAGTQGIPTVCTAYPSEGMPSSWRAEGANVTDSPRLSKLLDELSALRIARCLDYAPSQQAAALCGFDGSETLVEVTYCPDGGEAEASLTLSVGGLTQDGGARCVRLNGEDAIYTVDAGSLETVLSVAQNGLEG